MAVKEYLREIPPYKQRIFASEHPTISTSHKTPFPFGGTDIKKKQQEKKRKKNKIKKTFFQSLNALGRKQKVCQEI